MINEMNKRIKKKLIKRHLQSIITPLENYFHTKSHWENNLNAHIETDNIVLCIFNDMVHQWYSSNTGKIVFDFIRTFDKWTRCYYYKDYRDNPIDTIISDIDNILNNREYHIARSLMFEQYNESPQCTIEEYQRVYKQRFNGRNEVIK